MTTKPVRTALYARISITDPDTPKVANQLADLRELATKRGYDVVGEYVDDGLSAAKAENRPDFDRLLEDLAASKFDVVLATEEARLARNGLEKNMLMLTCIKAETTWETIRDGVVDPSTAAGSFMAGIRGVVDSFESARKSERQKSANVHKRAKGLPTPGQRAFGWRIDQMTLIPEEADLIRQGIDMILSGQKPWAVVKLWNESGIKTGRGNFWSSTSVISVLRRWRNAGWTEHQNEPIAEAQWPAICTKEELEAVRAILDLRTDTDGWNKPVGLCSGIAKCVCGQTMVRTGRANNKCYRCSSIGRPGAKSGIHVQIRASELDPKVRTHLVEAYLLDAETEATKDVEATELANLHKELASIQASKTKLLDVYMDGTITKPEFTRKNNELTTRETSLIEEIAKIGRASAHSRMLIESRKALFSKLDHPVDMPLLTRGSHKVRDELELAFDSLSLTEKRQLIAARLLIVVNPGRTIDRVSIKPFPDAS